MVLLLSSAEASGIVFGRFFVSFVSFSINWLTPAGVIVGIGSSSYAAAVELVSSTFSRGKA